MGCYTFLTCVSPPFLVNLEIEDWNDNGKR